MKKLRICIIDLIHNSHSNSLYRRIMFPNHLSIMPQIIAVWCRELGHEVTYSIFTGSKRLKDLYTDDADVVIFSSFSYTAHLAYALSNFFRSMGMITILGGPHARSYQEDACRNFDYVLGLTDKDLIRDLLNSVQRNRPHGSYLTANRQPNSIPGVRERWDFIEKINNQFPLLHLIPMIGSFGCPYRCDFCVDSEIPYQVLDHDQIKKDLRFLVRKMKHPRVSWYDPNFGFHFEKFMETLESAVPPGSVQFIAECTLSVLQEPNVERLAKNGFRMIIPGIESWFDYGKKARTGTLTGMDKVLHVAEQMNMIQRYIPQLQSNFIFGIDNNKGEEPFELTKKFIDLVPGAYPSYALLNVFGQNNKNNLMYETANRIIPFPFHMMMSVHILNVIPKNYSWEEFYVRFIDLLSYSFSTKAIYRRFKSNKMTIPRWLTLLISLSIGGAGKVKILKGMLQDLRNNKDFQAFVRKETNQVPGLFIQKVKDDLGPLWDWLPEKSLQYNPNVLTEAGDEQLSKPAVKSI